MAHTLQFVEAGQPLDNASKALIMLHGRGATSQDILSLTKALSLNGFYIIAPQATNYTWYPYSFLEPVERNEPWLSSALAVIHSIVAAIGEKGIKSERIYLLGFSQGACLALEYAARYAQKWGGVIAFTGGLIGDNIEAGKYKGDFAGAEVFLGNSDKDPHVPALRSEETRRIMEQLGAHVTLKIYPNMGHTINEDEFALANTILGGPNL